MIMLSLSVAGFQLAMAFKSTILLVFVTHVIFMCLVESKTPVSTDGEVNTVSSNEEATTEDLMKMNMRIYEKMLKNFTSVAVKKALPKMVKIIENVNLSSSCLSSLLKYVVSLKQIKVWAIKSKFILNFFENFH